MEPLEKQAVRLMVFRTVIAFTFFLSALGIQAFAGAEFNLWPFFYFTAFVLSLNIVYGLFYLGVLFATVALEEILRRAGIPWFEPEGRLPVSTVAGVTGLSVLATLLTPYSYHQDRRRTNGQSCG